MSLHSVHGLYDLLIGALAAAEISFFTAAFDGESQGKVADLQQFIAEFIINQRAIGEGKEIAVLVSTAQTQNILFPDQWLAT